MRAVFAAAWPLFKACLPACLPLAIIGVAASATPGSEAAISGEGHGLNHGREWWGLVVASTVLTLICYGAVLRQQLAIAAGVRLPLLESMRQSVRDVPFVLALIVLLVVPLLPAMLATAASGFGIVPLVLTLAALALLVYALFAWPSIAALGMNPWRALLHSVRLVRGRWRSCVALLAMLAAAIFVFVLLVGILTGVVMNLAGQGNPTESGMAFSVWLMGVILAVPVVYGGAVTVAAWRVVSAVPASPGDPAPTPGG